MSAVLGPSGDAVPSVPAVDIITVLTSAGPWLAKVWSAGGGGVEIRGYEKAKQVRVDEHRVCGIHEMSALLTQLEGASKSCIIRGRFVGHEAAAGLYQGEIERDAARGQTTVMPREGYTLRRAALFRDRPLHYMLIDVDGWAVPAGADGRVVDPVAEPEAAVEMFVEACLPACFAGVSYHWQLSSGAGHPDNAGKLKVHLVYWLAGAREGSELEAWVKAERLPIDGSVFRVVQPNYTAAPVFVEGAVDPVPRRSGLCEGWAGDEVELEIGEAVLERARSEKKGRREMVDPREKDGLIGLFHRTFEIEEVVERWLSDVFEFAGGGSWRLNFLQSASGAAEGAVVTENRQGIYNSHDSDPFGGRAANKWDLVRKYRFGHLDASEDAAGLALLGPGGWPSQVAMVAMVRELPEIVAAMREEGGGTDGVVASADLVAMQARIDACDDAVRLEEIAREFGQQRLSQGEIEILAGRLEARSRALNGRITRARFARWLRPRRGYPDLNEDGQPLCTIDNMCVLLERLEVTVRYNVISKGIEILIPGQSFTLDNKDSAALTWVKSEAVKAGMPVALVPEYLVHIADKNLYNPVMSWVGSREWDGVSRLERLYATVESDSPIKVKLMRKWLIQCIAAAASPDGIAGQGVLTLVGPQGGGKTRWFKSLAPREMGLIHTGLTLDVKNKDSILIAISHWIVELGEVDATFRKSDIAGLKAFITQPTDKIRRPYAVADSKYGRRTVFGASVNEDDFLHDRSGNRRFWTLRALAFRPDEGLDMQQLWAEVLVLWKQGEPFFLDAAELAELNEHNEQFTSITPVEEQVQTWVDWRLVKTGKVRWMTATEILQAMGYREPKLADKQKVGRAVRRLNGDQSRFGHKKLIYLAVPDQDDFLAGGVDGGV